jgi:hypothetical protein
MLQARIAAPICIGAAIAMIGAASANAATGHANEIARITTAPLGSASVATINLPLNMEPLALPGENRVHGEAPATLFAPALSIVER